MPRRFPRTWLLFSCSTAVLAAISAERPSGRAAGALALTRVTIVDVTAADPASSLRRGQTVLIEGQRITRVGATGSVAVPRGVQVVDRPDGYVIPGLWDAHAHLSQAGPGALAVYVANGVTTVRDLGGRISEMQGWKRRIEAGDLVGPRLFGAGPILEGAWWLDAAMRAASSDPALRSFPLLEVSPRHRLKSQTDASEAVRSIVKLGADVIKFRNLRSDEFRAVAAEAKRQGLPLVGHAPRDIPLGEAARLGMSSIEHAETVMLSLGTAVDPERRLQLARLASFGTAITPTLISDVAYRLTPDTKALAVINDSANRLDGRRRYIPRLLLDAWKFGLESKRYDAPTDWTESHRRQVADVQRARAAGVPLLVGTDLGVSLVYPGFSVHEELALLVEEARLSPLEALRAATVNPARSMRVADRSGQIAAGQRADLVVLGANPLENIRSTAQILAVVLNGRFMARADLDAVLLTAERVAKREAPPVH